MLVTTRMIWEPMGDRLQLIGKLSLQKMPPKPGTSAIDMGAFGGPDGNDW